MAGAPAPPTAARAGEPALWWRIHAWAGLKLSLPLRVILLTGTLAKIANETLWLLRLPMRAADPGSPPAVLGTRLPSVQERLGVGEGIETPRVPATSGRTAGRWCAARGTAFASSISTVRLAT